MGILDSWRMARSAVAGSNVIDFPAAQQARSGIRSPWTEGALTKFAWSDVFGTTVQPPDRADAMTLPPVVNGRAIILGELAARPLRAVKNGQLIKRQPAWLYRTNTDVSPWHRMAGTLDDLMFYGDSLWTVERGADEQITDAIRIPRDRWRIQEGRIQVKPDGDWRDAKRLEVIYFPGPFEGLLNVAGRTLRAAMNLEASWANRAATPLPTIMLRQKEQGSLEADEVDEVVAEVASARRAPDGGVMFIPWEYDASVEGENDSQMFVEARNAYKLDIANFLGLTASALDAALPKASLNYETQEGTQAQVENRLSYWTAPLEARLSMDDVCPRGQRIAFDFSDNPTDPGADTGPYQED